MPAEITLADRSIGALTALDNGTFLSVWNASGNVVMAQLYNLDGTKKGGSFALSASSAGANVNLAATNLGNGRVAIVWEQEGAKPSVYAKVIDADGKSVHDVFKIPSGTSAQTLDDISALPDGGFAVATINEGVATVVKVAADGTTAGPITIKDNALDLSMTRLQNGNLALYVHIDTPDYLNNTIGYILGTALSGPFYPGSLRDPDDTDPLNPQMTALSNGNILLAHNGTWGERDTLELELFSSPGASLGPGAFLMAGEGETIGAHVIKALPGGGFVFAYEQGDATDRDVYVGVSQSGALGGVSTERVGFFKYDDDQSAPKIAVLLDGRYVVSWTETVYGIPETRAHIFDPRLSGAIWTGTSAGEQYQGTEFSDNLNGSGGNDYLVGEAGSDVLNGGTGSDTLIGGVGDDIYHVDNSGDQVIDVSGVDTIVTTINYTLNSSIENLTASDSAGAIALTGNNTHNVLTGNAAANTLNGGEGNDTLDGAGGADRMVGGKGNDTYYVNHKSDKVVETSGQGTDTIYARVSYTISNYVEKLIGEGSSAISLSGNGSSNTITGNTGKNTLKGNAGNDILDGGLGNDVLYGGTGKDSFVFSTALHKTKTVDAIKDFVVKDDTIRLENAIFTSLTKTGKLNKAFFKIGPKAKDKNDYLVYDNKKGVLYYDADGSGKGAAIKIATLSKNLKMTHADFLVI
ncbi:calcium-binding protein [Microvirga sp. ACRRW]|uniref:calcium-binding protein n=1 Tax=Microvirga sp. ACRRW TaxID=2918205 RepID=UPI001EF420D7|nr:calcium-binding protein [Microvirga sp. ACRRW]MCG7394765.1 calcium-binding protein [Microvirga sp. ACRRW]